MGKVYAVIPVRMASSRLPYKPMVKFNGLTMIQHVHRRCLLAKNIEKVIVATCDDPIKELVESDDGLVVMTDVGHETCIDRVNEAIEKSGLDIKPEDSIVIVQGDEIQIEPQMLDEVASALEDNSIVNLICKIEDPKYITDINAVKIVFDPNDYALLYSRSPIPSDSRTKPDKVWQQTGVIGFRRDLLRDFSSMERTPLEIIESVDMLRIIENRIPLKVIKSEKAMIGIDTQEDVDTVVEIFKQDPLLKEYL